MKNGWRWAMMCSLLTAVVSTQAASCGGIVQATLAEMRAGAGEQWTADMAATARAAAGAACVKALSGRYAEAGAGANDAADAPSAGGEAAAAAESDKSSGLWPFSGAGVRSITGSPAKKPYERRRGD